MNEEDKIIVARSNGYTDMRMFGKTRRWLKNLKNNKKRHGYIDGVKLAEKDLRKDEL